MPEFDAAQTFIDRSCVATCIIAVNRRSVMAVGVVARMIGAEVHFTCIPCASSQQSNNRTSTSIQYKEPSKKEIMSGYPPQQYPPQQGYPQPGYAPQGFQQQGYPQGPGQPQVVYVQQPAQQNSNNGLMACLAALCCCCALEECCSLCC
ncbi:hypothetical protein SeLEV6574_g01134 [Synchytrium endobioticum]|uniref:Cysteine-rich transmembrane domain-containing protein n=1 Tax=Synchytrium endobioticum TaxID=286115 RepID=A0A507DF82_9FUNG|nr:hypothetical protein SeLEV6574_g01134 [Synchytrium endobioticum]